MQDREVRRNLAIVDDVVRDAIPTQVIPLDVSSEVLQQTIATSESLGERLAAYHRQLPSAIIKVESEAIELLSVPRQVSTFTTITHLLATQVPVRTYLLAHHQSFHYSQSTSLSPPITMSGTLERFLGQPPRSAKNGAGPNRKDIINTTFTKMRDNLGYPATKTALIALIFEKAGKCVGTPKIKIEDQSFNLTVYDRPTLEHGEYAITYISGFNDGVDEEVIMVPLPLRTF